MNQKETFNGTIKNHRLNLLVSFECRDDLVYLRKHLGTEDVERRVVERDSPILGRALGHTYLSILCCCESLIFHAGCLLINWFSRCVRHSASMRRSHIRKLPQQIAVGPYAIPRDPSICENAHEPIEHIVGEGP